MDVDVEQGSAGDERRERRRLVAGALAQDFAQNTTLHGLRYIAERGLSRAEKVFWTISFVTSVSLCGMLIWNVWEKWQSIPTIITLSEDLVSVQEVAFPAVTICPHTKVKQSVCRHNHFFHIMYRKRNEPIPDNKTLTQERLLIEAVLLLLGWSSRGSRRGPQYVDSKVVDKIIMVSPTFDDVFIQCKLYQDRIPCEELFKPVLTMEGVCFTMNTLAAGEILRLDKLQKNYSYLHTTTPSTGWSQSRGYFSFNSSASVYPRRGGGSSNKIPDVAVLLRQYRENMSVLYSSYNNGFKVYLHHPADLPQSSVYHYSAPPEQSVSFGIKLNVMDTSNSLKTSSPAIRRCYFPEERELKYFRAYTDGNCRLECLANYTLELCGCVWFHMPHNDTLTICTTSRLECFRRATERFDEQEGPYSKAGRCRCYPLCLQVQYEADIVKSLVYDYEEVYAYSMFIKDTGSPPCALTRVELFYKASSFVAMRRSELFGLTDFLANCGGLLGLFLGFSFLSLVEIAYFLTLRFSCSFRRYRQQPDDTGAKNVNRY